MKIFLLEDDLQLGTALSSVLRKAGYEVCWVRLVADAKKNLMDSDQPFAAALLDIGLPDGSGLDLLGDLRARDKTLPVIMLTARDSLSDRVEGLDAGADDYVPKPFFVEELLSRLRALIRRQTGHVMSDWKIGPLRIDPAKQRVWLNAEVVDLAPREYQILKALADSAGSIVTRYQLEQYAGGDPSSGGNAVEVHIHRLRRKLGAELITTVRGIGYILEDGN